MMRIISCLLHCSTQLPVPTTGLVKQQSKIRSPARHRRHVREVVKHYRPDYTWNRGGRLKELRIRYSISKSWELIIRNIWYCRLEFICDEICLRFFCKCSKSQKYDRKKFQWLCSDYSCDEFSQKMSVAKIFPSKFPAIFTNIFQRKIIPVYSIYVSWEPITRNIWYICKLRVYNRECTVYPLVCKLWAAISVALGVGPIIFRIWWSYFDSWPMVGSYQPGWKSPLIGEDVTSSYKFIDI